MIKISLRVKHFWTFTFKKLVIKEEKTYNGGTTTSRISHFLRAPWEAQTRGGHLFVVRLNNQAR
jgi:hypothetical protein